MRISTGQFKTHKARHGLTLVELLAATILASMLMVAVLGVLQSLTRQQKMLLDLNQTEPWQARFWEQLEWDLTNSRTVQVTPEKIVLEGYAGRDAGTQTLTHRPTRIEYSVLQTEATSLLSRYEVETGSRSLQEGVSEVLGVGIKQILLSASEPSLPAEGSEQEISVSPLQEGPIPDQVYVTLVPTDDSFSVLTHAFLLR